MPPDEKKSSTLSLSEPPAPAKPALPEKLRVNQEHGFYEDTGRLRLWHEGDVVTDPTEIALLLDRGAPCSPVTE